MLKTFRRYRTLFVALVGILVFGSSAKAVDENGELRRHQDNANRLSLMSPSVRPKVSAILTDLEANGHRPLIDGGVFRTPSQQSAKVKSGVSSVTWSFHMAKTPAGKPDSLAADITDIRWFWNSPNSYWLKLASSAESHKMTTGIYWGLSNADRIRIRGIISRKDWNAKYSHGQDPSHVEPTGITLGQAKAGQRPYGYKPPKGGAT